MLVRLFTSFRAFSVLKGLLYLHGTGKCRLLWQLKQNTVPHLHVTSCSKTPLTSKDIMIGALWTYVSQFVQSKPLTHDGALVLGNQSGLLYHLFVLFLVLVIEVLLDLQDSLHHSHRKMEGTELLRTSHEQTVKSRL